MRPGARLAPASRAHGAGLESQKSPAMILLVIHGSGCRGVHTSTCQSGCPQICARRDARDAGTPGS